VTDRATRGQPVVFDAWPPSMRPGLADVYAHNEFLSPIPDDRLWAWLVRARGWSRWYANCRRLRIETDDRSLEMGTTFQWMTFGATITSTVDLFDKPKALGWNWFGSTAEGYHVWLLEPVPGGTRLVTEESQRGPGPHLMPFLLRPLLHASHGMWLRSLSSHGSQRPPRTP
jgi:hypothetical protein